MPTRRLAWGYDEQGNQAAMQTEITYTDIEFDAELAPGLFQPIH